VQLSEQNLKIQFDLMVEKEKKHAIDISKKE